VGVGRVYRHFPTQHALLAELGAAGTRRLIAEVRAASQDEDPSAGLAHMVGFVLRGLIHDQAVCAALTDVGDGCSPPRGPAAELPSETESPRACVRTVRTSRLQRGTPKRLCRHPQLAAEIDQRVRLEVGTWPGEGTQVVPTHGDWQPRNWLIDEGVVRVIDFGRADLRPAAEDFVRLARQDYWRDLRPEARAGAGHVRLLCLSGVPQP
jgi:hypothetical protein